MAVDGHRLDLENIEETGLHERAKSLVEKIRTVRFSIQSRESFGHKTRMQSLESTHRSTIKVVHRSRRDCDLHRYAAANRFVRCAAGHDLHIVIPARFEISLKTPRNILHARIDRKSVV